ncbi:hypothetical protein G3I77_08120 [Streptomyces sp. D2-8]|uniref:hypothetical protein n=1 Tax=Streptomyces sp. D2-8 TaxID=2707767 RepID=UPI0020BDAC37|nr:hypothetical protein [Streptomyces sp. D2-8]MCK8433012.1 hypothetical protein [Streptomyces sp. D2-8]
MLPRIRGSPAGPAATAQPAAPRATRVLDETAHCGVYAGLALLIGIAVFVLACLRS